MAKFRIIAGWVVKIVWWFVMILDLIIFLCGILKIHLIGWFILVNPVVFSVL